MVPKALKGVIGKAEFTRSLGVPGRREAEARAVDILADWNAEIAKAYASTSRPSQRSAVPLPQVERLEERAVTMGYDLALKRVKPLIREKSAHSGGATSLRKKLDEHRIDTVRELNGAGDGRWHGRAERFFEKHGWSSSNNSEAFSRFTVAYARAGLDLFTTAIGQLEGNFDARPPSEFVQEIRLRRDSRACPGETLLELFDAYAVIRFEEGRKRKDTIAQDRIVVENFAKFVGESIAAKAVTAEHVRAWRDALVSVPAGYSRRAANSGLSLRQLAEKAKAEGAGRGNLVTVNKYLSTVSPLFTWLRSEGKVSANPCDGLFYSVKKAKGRRPPFNNDRMNLVLKSPLFVGFERDGKEWLPGDRRSDDWRYWIPLVGFFTGARVGEIAQLNIDDVAEDDGFPFIWIKHEERAGQTTKSGVCRITAIHSTLRKLGFLDYVERRRAEVASDGDLRLFPGFEASSRGQIGAVPSRFFRTYLKRIGLKAGADGFGSHSFRHGLADRLRISGLLDHEIAVALGHKVTSVTGGYGMLPQGTVRRISEMLEQASFYGIELDHLVPDRALKV